MFSFSNNLVESHDFPDLFRENHFICLFTQQTSVEPVWVPGSWSGSLGLVPDVLLFIVFIFFSVNNYFIFSSLCVLLTLLKLRWSCVESREEQRRKILSGANIKRSTIGYSRDNNKEVRINDLKCWETTHRGL